MQAPSSLLPLQCDTILVKISYDPRQLRMLATLPEFTVSWKEVL